VCDTKVRIHFEPRGILSFKLASVAPINTHIYEFKKNSETQKPSVLLPYFLSLCSLDLTAQKRMESPLMSEIFRT